MLHAGRQHRSSLDYQPVYSNEERSSAPFTRTRNTSLTQYTQAYDQLGLGQAFLSFIAKRKNKVVISVIKNYAMLGPGEAR